MTRDEIIAGLRVEIERAQQRGDIYLDVVDVRVLEAAAKEIEQSVPVVHGQWIKEVDRVNHWHCSQCNMVYGLSHIFHAYCPHCGAKMNGGNNDGRSD